MGLRVSESQPLPNLALIHPFFIFRVLPTPCFSNQWLFSQKTTRAATPQRMNEYL